MERNISYRLLNLRIAHLDISYPSLYQLRNDLMVSFLKLQYINCNLNELATLTRYKWLDGSTVVEAVQK